MHEVLVNRLGGLSLPRESVVRLTDRPDMTLDVYRGRKTTMQQQQQILFCYTPFLNETKLYLQKSSFRRVKLNGFKDRILHGPPMLVDKANFGLVLYNHANLYRFEESPSYWSGKRISVFLCFSLVNQRHTSGITVYNRTVNNIITRPANVG